MEIRIAEIKDLKKITDLHCRSFKPEDHIPMMLGQNYVKATYRWLITSNEAYVLVAVIDDIIVGLVAVCDEAFTKPMFIACLPEFFLSLLIKPKRAFSKTLWNRMLRQPKLENSKNILSEIYGFAQMTIGVVDKDYRGREVFGRLIEATKNHSKERGSLAIRGGVYKKNKASQRVFIKEGWEETKILETDDTCFYTFFFDDNFKKNIFL